MSLSPEQEELEHAVGHLGPPCSAHGRCLVDGRGTSARHAACTAHHSHVAWACPGSDLAGRGGGRRSRGPGSCCPLSRADLMVSAGKGDAFTGLSPSRWHSSDPSPCRAGPSLFGARPPSISVPSRGLSSLSPLLSRGGIEAKKRGQVVGFCRRPHLESEWSSRRCAPRPGLGSHSQ